MAAGSNPTSGGILKAPTNTFTAAMVAASEVGNMGFDSGSDSDSPTE